MSTHFKCDLCGEEILINGFGGTYIKIKPNPEHFKDPINNPQIIKDHKDLCEKCCLMIDKAINDQEKKITVK